MFQQKKDTQFKAQVIQWSDYDIISVYVSPMKTFFFFFFTKHYVWDNLKLLISFTDVYCVSALMSF